MGIEIATGKNQIKQISYHEHESSGRRVLLVDLYRLNAFAKYETRKNQARRIVFMSLLHLLSERHEFSKSQFVLFTSCLPPLADSVILLQPVVIL